MIRFVLSLAFSLSVLFCSAQNLVPNPSFEEYLDCPQSTGELHQQVIDWESWQLTPDFFHECNNNGLGTAGVPFNAWGYQMPITGNGYSGIYTFQDNFVNTREYLAAPLIEPLEIGIEYYVMLYASMYDGGLKEPVWCQTNNVGLRFFKNPEYSAFPPNANPLEPDNFAHLNSNEVIDDFTDWTLIDGWITAEENYNWVAIGNFFIDEETIIQRLNIEDRCSGIYYIENVCVARYKEDCDYLVNVTSEARPNSLSIYPNPATDVVYLQLPWQGKHVVDIFNSQGHLVLYIQDYSANEPISLTSLQEGFYVLRIQKELSFYTLKLIVQ